MARQRNQRRFPRNATQHAAHAGARGARSVPWGPWSWAPIISGTKGIIGYGATCSQHFNAGDHDRVECKKQLMLSRCGGDHDKCRLAMKAWLYCGRHLDETKVVELGPRKAHLKTDPLDVLGGWTEELLDAAVTQL